MKPNFQVLDGHKGKFAKVLPSSEAPNDIEAEAYVLACCFLDPGDMLPRCRAMKFKPTTFFNARHGMIFGQMLALHDAQQPIDLFSVERALQSVGELETVGGRAFLVVLSGRCATTAQDKFFLERVRATWIRRQIIERATRLAAAAQTEAPVDEPLGDWLSPHVVWFENALARLVHGGRGDVYTLEKRIAEVRQDVALRAEGKEDRSGWIWTGFSAFDELARDKCLRPFHSLEEDGIVLIGGGSSFGKSVLMRQWSGEALQSGQTVLVYTLETSVKGFCRALAASWAGVDLLQLHRMPRDLLKKFDDHLAGLLEVANKRLFIFQNEPGSEINTIEDLGRHARSWAMQHGPPRLLVMDYLQRLDTKKRYNTGEQRVTHVSHGFQALQRELDCCCMGGAQLNDTALREMRTVKHDEDGKVIHVLPTRSALRESQALYHDADVVIFLHVPVVDCRGADQASVDVGTPETWLVQDKRRNGVRGICKTWFEKRFLRFRELAPGDAAAAAWAQAEGTGRVPAGQRVNKRDWRRGRDSS